MRKTPWLFVAAVATAATLLAAPAHADPEQDLLNILESYGDFSMGPWDNNVIFLPKGRQVCTDLQNGISAQSVADTIHNTEWLPPWTPLEAQQFVTAAQLTLCPNVNVTGSGWPWPVFYRCDNPQPIISVVFYRDQSPPGAMVTWDGQQAIVRQQPTASGVSYSGEGVDYTEQQGQIHVNFRGTQLNCTAP